MIAAGEDHGGACLPDRDDGLVEHGERVRFGGGRVEDVACDGDYVDVVVGDCLGDRSEDCAQVLVSAVAVEGAANVPVRSVEDAHVVRVSGVGDARKAGQILPRSIQRVAALAGDGAQPGPSLSDPDRPEWGWSAWLGDQVHHCSR